MLAVLVLLGCTLVSTAIATLPCTPSIPTALVAPMAVACLVPASAELRRAHWFLLAALSVPFALAETTTSPFVLLIPGAIALVRLFVRSRPLGAITVLALLAYGISLPNVFCFTCRTKQSEAKTNLAGLFTAERAYFGEYGRYTTDLADVNWRPDGTPRYLYGFSPACTSDGGGPTDTSDPRLVLADSYRTEKMRALDGRALDHRDLPRSFASSSAFLAVAVGDIDTDEGHVQLDIWAIDEQKRLVNLSNDCIK